MINGSTAGRLGSGVDPMAELGGLSPIQLLPAPSLLICPPAAFTSSAACPVLSWGSVSWREPFTVRNGGWPLGPGQSPRWPSRMALLTRLAFQVCPGSVALAQFRCRLTTRTRVADLPIPCKAWRLRKWDRQHRSGGFGSSELPQRRSTLLLRLQRSHSAIHMRALRAGSLNV